MTDVKPTSSADTPPRSGLGRKVLRAPIRTKGVVTIPQEIRNQLDLQEGDEVIFTVDDGRVVLTPAAVIPRDQAWFWTAEWQAREAEADAEIASGGGMKFDSDDAFLSAVSED